MTQFSSDTFTGAANADLSTYNPNWQPVAGVTGALVLDSAGVRARQPSGAGASSYYRADAVPSSADYSVSCDVLGVSSTSGSIGVIGRASSVDDTCYEGSWKGGTGFQIVKSVSGGRTVLATSGYAGLTNGEVHNLRLEMIGSTISLFVDGSAIAAISVTDADIADAGYPGIRAFNVPSGQLRLDNFSADQTASAGGGPYTLAAEAGALTLTGGAAAIKLARILAAYTGSFGLDGTSVSLSASRRLDIDAAALTLTGSGASLTAARRMTLASSAFALTGNDAQLVYSPAVVAEVLVAQAGSFSLTGGAASLRVTRMLSADTGSLSLACESATLRCERRMAAELCAFAISGNPANLISSVTFIGQVPLSRTVNFGGGSNRVAFAGGTNRVNFDGGTNKVSF